MEDTDQKEDFAGYVLFLPYAVGSKSESFRPALAMGHGGNVTLFRKGDNPFANESFLPLHGKYCKLSGELDERKNVLLVESIQEADPPFPPAKTSPSDSSPEPLAPDPQTDEQVHEGEADELNPEDRN